MDLDTAKSPGIRACLPGTLKKLLPAAILLTMIMLVHYQFRVDSAKDILHQQGRAATELTRQLMNTRLGEMIADVHILSDQVIVTGGELNRQHLTQLFLRFAQHKPNYSQIRFLSTDGQEQVRINNTQDNPKPVPVAELQNKAHRYYVQQALQLKPKQIYLSPFDLNVEKGRIEYPLNPTLRAASSVYSANGERLGIVVVNLLGNELAEEVWGRTPIAADAIALASDTGYIEVRPGATQDRVVYTAESPPFMRDAKGDLALGTAAVGELNSDDKIIAFSTLVVPDVVGNKQWRVFTTLDGQVLNASRQSFLFNYLPLYGVIFIIIAVASLVNTWHQLRYYQTLAHNAYERSFRTLLEDIDLAAVNIDQNGVIQFCNHYFLRAVGYSQDEVLGKKWLSLFEPTLHPAEHWIRLQQMFGEWIDPEARQQQILNKAQEPRTFAWNCTLQTMDSGVQLSLIGKDITEKLIIEEQLKHLRHAVEQSANTVIITDERGHITYANAAFTKLTGYHLEEVLGCNPKFLKSGETSGEEYARLWTAIQSGQSWQGQFHNRKKNGELFWERALISPVKSPSGETSSYIAIKQDITEEKRLQAELEQQMQETIQNQQLAAVGRMANMVVHDLRNPLSSVKMALQMSNRKPDLESESRELFQISLEQIGYMESILEDLLSYSRPDELTMEWLDINALMRFVLTAQQSLIDERGIALEQHYDAALPAMFGDQVKLCQSIQNLILNALQAADGQGDAPPRVVLTTTAMKREGVDWISVTLCNTGTPIDPQLTEKAFEAFYTTKAKGTGLGLAIVRRLVKQHGGEVRLAPMGEEGTCAYLLLPVQPPVREEI